MGFEIDKDEFERNLINALEKESGLRFGEENEIPFVELFTEKFMQLYTEFDSIEDFFEVSPWDVEGQDDLEAIPENEMDEYVDAHTDFPEWEVMMDTAGELFLESRFN